MYYIYIRFIVIAIYLSKYLLQGLTLEIFDANTCSLNFEMHAETLDTTALRNETNDSFK